MTTLENVSKKYQTYKNTEHDYLQELSSWNKIDKEITREQAADLFEGKISKKNLKYFVYITKHISGCDENGRDLGTTTNRIYHCDKPDDYLFITIPAPERYIADVFVDGYSRLTLQPEHGYRSPKHKFYDAVFIGEIPTKDTSFDTIPKLKKVFGLNDSLIEAFNLTKSPGWLEDNTIKVCKKSEYYWDIDNYIDDIKALSPSNAEHLLKSLNIKGLNKADIPLIANGSLSLREESINDRFAKFAANQGIIDCELNNTEELNNLALHFDKVAPMIIDSYKRCKSIPNSVIKEFCKSYYKYYIKNELHNKVESVAEAISNLYNGSLVRVPVDYEKGKDKNATIFGRFYTPIDYCGNLGSICTTEHIPGEYEQSYDYKDYRFIVH